MLAVIPMAFILVKRNVCIFKSCHQIYLKCKHIRWKAVWETNCASCGQQGAGFPHLKKDPAGTTKSRGVGWEIILDYLSRPSRTTWILTNREPSSEEEMLMSGKTESYWLWRHKAAQITGTERCQELQKRKHTFSAAASTRGGEALLASEY